MRTVATGRASTLFAELSRLLDSPLGTMATDHARREFVGRWKETLDLDPAEEQSLDDWLAGLLKDSVSDARRIFNDPELMRLALDKASGKPIDLKPEAPSLAEYASHWLLASAGEFDREVMELLIAKYPPPAHPRIQPGYSDWDSFGNPSYPA